MDPSFSAKGLHKNTSKVGKGIYYLKERKSRDSRNHSSKKKRVSAKQLQMLKNIRSRWKKNQDGIYSSKRPVYDPVNSQNYPGEGRQNRTNLHIMKARRAMKEDGKFHYNKMSNLKIYSKKFTEAYLSIEEAR